MPRRALTQDEIDQSRDAICDAAFRLYKVHGYDGVTLRSIGKALGTSPMLAYRYFEGKEQIFAALRAKQFGRLADRLDAVPDDGAPLDYLRSLADAYADFARKEPHSYRLLYVLDIEATGGSKDVEHTQDRTRQILLEATQRAVASGDVTGDPSLLAHTLWASLHGLLALSLAGQLNYGASFDDLFPAMLANLLPPRS